MMTQFKASDLRTIDTTRSLGANASLALSSSCLSALFASSCVLFYACDPAPPKSLDGSPSSSRGESAAASAGPSSSEDGSSPTVTPVSETGASGAGESGSSTERNADCFEGLEGCACYSNGTCDPIEGAFAECVDHRCVRRVSPLPGTLSGACGPEIDCDPFEGRALTCRDGRCVMLGCPDGQLGCPCGPSRQCRPVNDEPVTCRDLFCVPSGCDSGSLDCSCAANDQCDDAELTCDLNVCRQVARYQVRLAVSPLVRACDLLLEVDEGTAEVRFSDGIHGRHKRRGRRVAISFIAESDAAVPNAPIDVILDRPQRSSADADRVLLVNATCYDRLGHPDRSAQVVLQR